MLADYPNLGSLAPPAETNPAEEAMDAIKDVVDEAIDAIQEMESAGLNQDVTSSGEAH
jgi:hypothetical protein